MTYGSIGDVLKNKGNYDGALEMYERCHAIEDDAAQLTKEIAELDEDISIWQRDIDAATNVEDNEKADSDALHKACRELHSKRAAKRKPLPP